MQRTIVIPRRLIQLGLYLGVLAAVLLALAILRPLLPAWAGGTGPDAAARAVAEAALTVDYREQGAWKARLYPLCTAAGIAFWEENLRQGLWTAAEQRNWVTSQVEIAESVILDQVELEDAAAAVVRVRGVVQSRTISRQEPFVQIQVLERAAGGWRFASLLAQGNPGPVSAAMPPLQQLVMVPATVPAGTARAWLLARPGTSWRSLPSIRGPISPENPDWLGFALAQAPGLAPASWPPGREHVLVGRE